MNSKITTNSQLLPTNLKKKKTQTTRTGKESELWRSFGELSVGRMVGEGENGGKGTGIKKNNWWVQNRQEKVKNSIGNGGAKELMCMTHGHELRWGE